jgi:hypothetical protein
MRETSIQVIWNCDMSDKCINKEDPGRHGGDEGYGYMRFCRGEAKEPTPMGGRRSGDPVIPDFSKPRKD